MDDVIDIYRFICFLIEYVDEDDYLINNNSCARNYFMNGGCYELYKIVKYYFPESKCVVHKNVNHCAVLYKDKIYDATGVRKDIGNFRLATKQDFDYMDSFFGGNWDFKHLTNTKLVNDIKECNIEKRLKR